MSPSSFCLSGVKECKQFPSDKITNMEKKYPIGDDYPQSPEMELILRIVANWGNAVEMANMEGCLREYAKGPKWVRASVPGIKGGEYVAKFKAVNKKRDAVGVASIDDKYVRFLCPPYHDIMWCRGHEELKYLQILDESAGTTDDWISVDDRLPELLEYVTVYNTEGATLIGRLMSNGWVAMFADGEHLMGELTATYWRPLPDPPKRKEVKP